MAFQYMGSPLHMLVTCWRGAAASMGVTVHCQLSNLSNPTEYSRNSFGISQDQPKQMPTELTTKSFTALQSFNCVVSTGSNQSLQRSKRTVVCCLRHSPSRGLLSSAHRLQIASVCVAYTCASTSYTLIRQVDHHFHRQAASCGPLSHTRVIMCASHIRRRIRVLQFIVCDRR